MTSLQLVDADIPPLDDKVAVVTGGSSGIGLGAVQVLCEHHAHVIILDISPPPQAISSSDFVTYLETDISSWPSLVRSFAKISKQHGGIDIAIGNAGIAENNTYLAKCLMPATGSEEEWNILENEGDAIAKMHEVVDVNFKGTSNFVLLASRMMKASGGGSIVLTTSATAYMPEHSIPLYCATKAGVRYFSFSYSVNRLFFS
jgi:NAD(P)-dependent dehydrogenase (short-subunit alcohol dehydrogenase family)